jgi:Mn-dependent DtxR family transcriptional regulator
LETLGTKVDKTTSVNSLKKLTKQQLFDLADKKGIKIKKSGTKADVIKQISSAK